MKLIAPDPFAICHHERVTQPGAVRCRWGCTAGQFSQPREPLFL